METGNTEGLGAAVDGEPGLAKRCRGHLHTYMYTSVHICELLYAYMYSISMCLYIVCLCLYVCSCLCVKCPLPCLVLFHCACLVTSADIPVIPDIEELQEEQLLSKVSAPPSVAVHRVATYKQLDSDLHKHSDLYLLVSGLALSDCVCKCHTTQLVIILTSRSLSTAYKTALVNSSQRPLLMGFCASSSPRIERLTWRC